MKLIRGTPVDRLRDQKGMVLVIVMSFAAMVVLSTLSLATMIKQDTELIGAVRHQAQAQYVAEAGLSYAFARIKNEDFSARTDFQGSLDTGSYDVSFSEYGDRYLVTSVGTVAGVSKTVSAEIENLSPEAMLYSCVAGGDLKINGSGVNVEINGDIHANNNVYLRSSWFAGNLTVSGKVSAAGFVKEGSRLHVRDGFWGGFQDYRVYINGLNNDKATIYEGESRANYPVFDFAKYKQEAEDSGDYYDTDQVFDSVNLNPDNGIVFVDGDATIEGVCTISGGIIADDIQVNGSLVQMTSGTRNVIVARDGDIGLSGDLTVEEALIYAVNDIRSGSAGVDIDINGVMMARRDIYIWDFVADIEYNYAEIYPSDIGSGNEDQTFGIVSWNR